MFLCVVDREIFKNGFMVFLDQQRIFCFLVREEEIYIVFFLIEDNKVLGIDGFNVFFFNFLKKKWCIIKSDVIDVVMEFFYNVKIFGVIIYIYFILIFKKFNVFFVKDYCFIVCCIIFIRLFIKCY